MTPVDSPLGERQAIGDLDDVEAWLNGEPYGTMRPGSPNHTDTRLIRALCRSGLAHDARDIAAMAGVRPDIAIKKLRNLASSDSAAPVVRRPDLGADVYEYQEG